MEWLFRCPAPSPDGDPVIVFRPGVMQAIDTLAKAVDQPVDWFCSVTPGSGVLLVDNIFIPDQQVSPSPIRTALELLRVVQSTEPNINLWGRASNTAIGSDGDDDTFENMADGSPFFIRVIADNSDGLSVALARRGSIGRPGVTGAAMRYVYDAPFVVGFTPPELKDQRRTLKAIQDGVRTLSGRKAVKTKSADGHTTFNLS